MDATSRYSGAVKPFNGEGSSASADVEIWASNVEGAIARQLTSSYTPSAVQQVSFIGQTLLGQPAQTFATVFTQEWKRDAETEDRARSPARLAGGRAGATTTRGSSAAAGASEDGAQPSAPPFQLSETATRVLDYFRTTYRGAAQASLTASQQLAEWRFNLADMTNSLLKLRTINRMLPVAHTDHALATLLYECLSQEDKQQVRSVTVAKDIDWDSVGLEQVAKIVVNHHQTLGSIAATTRQRGPSAPAAFNNTNTGRRWSGGFNDRRLVAVATASPDYRGNAPRLFPAPPTQARGRPQYDRPPRRQNNREGRNNNPVSRGSGPAFSFPY